MMNILSAYDEWAKTYDEDDNATRDLDKKVTGKILGNLQTTHVLEIGCGTGKNTKLLSQFAETVNAIDFSTKMLVKAKAKVKAKNVSFYLADITDSWPFTNGAFDLVVCNLVLEHIRDLMFIFAEAERTLVKQGKFFISELHPYRQYLGQKANFYGNEGRQEVEAFTHHISDYHNAAEHNGLKLEGFHEWWHETDQDKPPRLVSFVFAK